LAEPVKTGYEVQMLGKYSGSLIGIRGNFPDESIYKPKEWNHLMLTVRGHGWIEGQRRCEVDFNTG
jgi:hypothetical protein